MAATTYKVANPRGIPKGVAILTYEGADGPVHWYEGDTMPSTAISKVAVANFVERGFLVEVK